MFVACVWPDNFFSQYQKEKIHLTLFTDLPPGTGDHLSSLIFKLTRILCEIFQLHWNCFDIVWPKKCSLNYVICTCYYYNHDETYAFRWNFRMSFWHRLSIPTAGELSGIFMISVGWSAFLANSFVVIQWKCQQKLLIRHSHYHSEELRIVQKCTVE